MEIEGGAGQLHLSKDKIERILLPKPKPGKLESLLNIIESQDAEILREIENLEKLNCIKFGLQDDLLTGRVLAPETIMEGAESA